MRKSLCLAGAIIATALMSSAAVINYAFDESNVYAANMMDSAGVIVSDIAYIQGSQSDTSTVAGVAYESNISTDNMFVVCSLDTGPFISSYSTDVSRLEFELTADAGSSIDFSAATLSLDLAGISSNTPVYRTNLRLAYNVNGAGWVTDVQKQVDTTLVASNLMDTVLFDDSTDALLEGYILESGAFVHEDSFSWSLSSLGTLSAGDTVEFALLVYDQRNAAAYYTAIDNIQINDLAIELSTLIHYTFDESSVYEARTENAGGVTVSSIAYLQGTTSDATKAAAVAYQSNVSGDNLFAVCSSDLNANETVYSTAASRLEFDMTANTGASVDFSSAVFTVDLAAITTPTAPVAYLSKMRLAYSINGAAWVTRDQKTVDTTLVASNLMDTVLFDDSTDALLEGYTVPSGAFVHEQSFNWALSDLGTLASGDTVEFAVMVFDSRNSALYYTGVDNIKISGLTIDNGTPPPPTPPPPPTVSFEGGSLFGNGQDVITWTTVQGSGYVYSVYYSTNLLNGFLPLETNLPDTVQSWTSTVSSKACFYQIRTQ